MSFMHQGQWYTLRKHSSRYGTSFGQEDLGVGPLTHDRAYLALEVDNRGYVKVQCDDGYPIWTYQENFNSASTRPSQAPRRRQLLLLEGPET